MPACRLKNVINVAQFRIKIKEIFDMKEFYKALHDWVVDHEWQPSVVAVDKEGEPFIMAGDADHFETLYHEKRQPDGSKEYTWWWRLLKLPHPNSYYRFHLDIDSKAVPVFDVELVREGKRIKAQKGEIEISVAGFIEFDYEGRWSKHPILRFFNKIFPQKIFKKELYEERKLELYREVYQLQDFIKRWFRLRSFLPFEQVKPFKPPKVY